MFDIVLLLAVFATLLVVVAVSQPVAVRLKLAPVVLLAVIGVAIGAVSIVLLRTPLSNHFNSVASLFADLPVGAETFIYVFLPLLVFEGAITADVRRMLEDAAPILMLAVVATVVCTAVVGIALWPLAGLPLVVCLLLGSVVATTDPAAVIAVFRDVGAAARLTRLVEGEALLNDAAAIVMFTVLLGMIVSGQQPDFVGGAAQFLLSFFGGAALGLLAGRALLQLIPWTRDDRLAEATLTVALPYLVFIAAEHLLHVSGVVAVLCSGLTVSAFGRSRITPYNWSFIVDLWAQIAFWAHSLVFVLASILVPKLLLDMQFHDVMLIAALIVAVFAARLLVLFLLLPLLSLAKLTQPISTAYKLAIAWGGLRGALTLVLALAVTENPALTPEIQRFVAVLATGLVLFTLLVNGTTLRFVIRLLGLDRLSPVDQALRDRVLALSYAEIGETIRIDGERARNLAFGDRERACALRDRDGGGKLARRSPRRALPIISAWRSAWWRSAIRSGCWRSRSWPSERPRPSPCRRCLETRKPWARARGATGGSATSAAPKPRSPFRSRSPPPISSIAASASCAFSPTGSATGSRCCS